MGRGALPSFILNLDSSMRQLFNVTSQEFYPRENILSPLGKGLLVPTSGLDALVKYTLPLPLVEQQFSVMKLIAESLYPLSYRLECDIDIYLKIVGLESSFIPLLKYSFCGRVLLILATTFWAL